MNLLLAHIDIMPIVYGLLIFVGIAITFHKLLSGQFVALVIDVFIFWLVFNLHGHSMTGGFAAVIAAMAAGIIFPMMIRRAYRRGTDE